MDRLSFRPRGPLPRGLGSFVGGHSAARYRGKRGVSKMAEVTFQKLSAYVRGRVAYFRAQQFKELFERINPWMRAPLRSMQLAKWKKPRKFQPAMIAAGVPAWRARRTWVKMKAWRSVNRKEVKIVLSGRYQPCCREGVARAATSSRIAAERASTRLARVCLRPASGESREAASFGRVGADVFSRVSRAAKSLRGPVSERRVSWQSGKPCTYARRVTAPNLSLYKASLSPARQCLCRWWMSAG